MIIGTKNVDLQELVKACESQRALDKFCEKLVPLAFTHVKEIHDNQRYYIAMKVRNLKDIPYARKKTLTEHLLNGIIVRGTINTVVDIEDLMAAVSVSTIYKTLFREELRRL